MLVDANEVEPPVSKISALELLWEAVWPFSVDAKHLVLDTLLSACQVTNGWRAGRIMNHVALVVATEDKAHAQRLIDSMRESAYKRHLMQAGRNACDHSFSCAGVS